LSESKLSGWIPLIGIFLIGYGGAYFDFSSVMIILMVVVAGVLWIMTADDITTARAILVLAAVLSAGLMGAALERADAPPAVEQEPQSLPEQVEDLVGDSGGGGPISPALQDAQPSAEETP